MQSFVKHVLSTLERKRERGEDIANGNMRGDEKGELIYIGKRGESMVDYVLVNQKAWDKIEKMEIGNRVESDHQPLEVEIRIKKEREIENYKVEIKEIVDGRKKTLSYTDRGEGVRMEGESVEKMWQSLKKGVKECEIKREVKIWRKRLVEHSWWDA